MGKRLVSDVIYSTGGSDGNHELASPPHLHFRVAAMSQIYLQIKESNSITQEL